MARFSCTMITPEGELIQKEVWQIAIRSKENSFAMRARHEDLLYATELCTAEIAVSPDSRETLNVKGLLLEFSKNRCLMVCKSAESVAP
jgi:F0F1-type ATP synthase epsilon subunit